MPFHWLKIGSSDPEERRAAVIEICKRHNATLGCDEQIFYDRQGQAYALVTVPEDPCDEGALLRELGAIEVLYLLDATEQKALTAGEEQAGTEEA